MVTIALVLVFVVVSVPLGIAAQRWLFKQADEVFDPEWELYQQRNEQAQRERYQEVERTVVKLVEEIEEIEDGDFSGIA